MDVIVLSDSSDASSESETSASTTPAQSVGYADAVEAALAMAAALGSTESRKKSEPKKKTPAPPLLPKSKIRRRPRPAEKTRMTPSVHRRQDREVHRFIETPRSSDRLAWRNEVNRQRDLETQRTKSRQPVDVVDLMSSSSSSSDSSDSGCSRSSSESSVASSDGGSRTLTPAKDGKKRLVLNDRALGKSAPRPLSFSDQHAKRTEASGRVQWASHADNRASKAGVPAHGGKRKRVVPQMRRESNGGIKQARAPVKAKNTKSASNGKRPRNSASTASATATKDAPLSISSSSASSSPASSPRTVPARKSATTPSATSHTASRAREGETDAFGRYRCRKTVSASAKPSGKRRTTSPSPASAVSPPPSPSPRKKRRVLTYFNTDSVALNDIQAQERELAWIRWQRKQTQTPSRPPRVADQKQKTCRDVIDVDDHSDVNSVGHSEDAQENGDPHDQIMTRVKCPVAVEGTRSAVSSDMLFHPTSYRGIYLDEAPLNILSLRGCSVPFESDCNHPLTFYDDSDTLARQCSILENFGKPTKCISSMFPSEAAKPQIEVTRAVSVLVTEQLPIIRRCHRRKVRAILAEARQKISKYQAALRDQRSCGQKVVSHRLPRSAVEKHVVRQLKTVQHLSAGTVSFQIGRGDGFVREKSVSSLIQVNRVEEIRPLRKYTTSIGLRANYRVEDDPILRYTATTRPNGTSGVGEVAKKYGLRMGDVADEEVVECVLRLVVGSLGDSEQVFHALKSELEFSQAYTAYSELKKLHDSRQRAGDRLERVEELSLDEESEAGSDVATIIKLMGQSSLSNASRARSLRQRLQPPIRNLESSLVDNLVDGATAGMAVLGLRATSSYAELADVYCGSFCRMCYRYACHEHGGDHPLPTRRVDPVYPHSQLPLRVAPGDVFAEDADMSDSSDDDVFHLRGEESGGLGLAHAAASARSSAGRETGASTQAASGIMGDDGSASHQQRRQRKLLADPSEYIDASHLSLMAAKMHSFLSTDSACSEHCWKRGEDVGSSKQRMPVSAAELGVTRKLRETMGDNSCLLAAVVGSVSCIELHELIREQTNDEHGAADGAARSGRRMRNWKHGRRSGGSNHELLQRTRNQRLQDRGTENHEYKPCMHEGMCDSTGCSCMKRDHMCEKACACSRDCPNRFEGCTCRRGECRTNNCPCFAALRECDPDVCSSCGASEVAVVATVTDGRCAKSPCGNVNVIRSKHVRLARSFSSIHGYGMYAREAISANEFVYEYTGAMLSQDEAERRGLIYDHAEMSYLFDLNEDAVLDALRSGNKSKFINHDSESPNCTAKVVSVCGVHHITIWTLRDIAVGEELVFNYGYKRSVGPDWSQRRANTKETS
ncbi:hypothetical protein KRP22_002156 [Phytophthora ramorum]|nr:Histone-lysine N-methyltransferase EZH1 [Phytophthora ramorum]